MNDTELLQKLAEANAFPDSTPLPEEIWAPELALREIERRIGMSQKETDTRTEPTRVTTEGVSEPMTGAPAGPGWPRLRVAVAALTVVLVAGAVFMLRGAEEGLIAGQAPGPLDTYVAALQANDVEAAMAVVSKDVVDGFTPWLIASDTSGTEVTNCRVINETTGQIACDVDMGPDFFYTLIGGESETVLYVDPVDGRLDLVRFPEPDDWSAMRQFGTWMKEFHADQYPLLFDSSGGTIWSGEAGRLQFEFLDEYLDYLASQG